MYRFSTSLPYLLAQLGMRMGELFSRELARDGLTLPMYRVLAALAEQGTPQRLGELAALTSVEASTLSRLLGTMQRMSLVTRERPETNQRSLAVDLAPRGIELAARLIPRAAHYEAVATGGPVQAGGRRPEGDAAAGGREPRASGTRGKPAGARRGEDRSREQPAQELRKRSKGGQK